MPLDHDLMFSAHSYRSLAEVLESTSDEGLRDTEHRELANCVMHQEGNGCFSGIVSWTGGSSERFISFPPFSVALP